MAIKAGQLIHVANQILVDRAQTAGPGTVNLNRTKIYELGNYLAVGSITDIPDLSFTMESLDASAELEAVLCGFNFGGTNATQLVTLTGTPTGGTFTLSFSGQTTAAIAFDATAATVQTRLENLSNIAVGEVSVTGVAGGPWTVVFSGTLTSSGTTVLLTGTAGGLTGGTSPAVTVTASDGLADGFAMRLDQSKPIDVASEFKMGKTAASPFDTVGAVAIPFLVIESVSYRFGVTADAAQTVTLKGDGLFYTPGSVYIQEVAGTGIAGQTILLEQLAYPFNGDVAAASTRYALSVSMSTGERLTFGTEFSEGVVGGGTTKTVTLTLAAAVPTTTTIRISYASDTVKAFPQASHAVATAVRPAAIRGRNITVAVGGVALADRWTSVQSVQLDYKVALQRDEEFGNSQIVTQDYDVPDVSGNISIRPRDYAELYKRVRTIAGVSANEVAGALTTGLLPLYIELHSPDTGVTLKSFYVPDARFNLPGYSGRVQQKLDVQMDWTSDTGDCTVYKGRKPGAST